VQCAECDGFEEIAYGAARTSYQVVMRDGHVGAPSDLRLARHRPEIRERFASIIRACREDGRLNTTISSDVRKAHGLKKMAIRVLDPLSAAPTITSLPDDLLHYSEPRTLTVRENARLQTFPDWFAFRGKYTTGGDRRRREVPRFTQVANAVPPLLAEQIGSVLLRLASSAQAVDMLAEGLADVGQRSAMHTELPAEVHHPSLVDDDRRPPALD
jgi:DNA (cytosine-5)-methyltransferase 1